MAEIPRAKTVGTFNSRGCRGSRSSSRGSAYEDNNREKGEKGKWDVVYNN